MATPFLVSSGPRLAGAGCRYMTETSFWRDKRILVTGGASFIGSHLVERLVGEGARVRVADDLSSGRLENLNEVINEIDFREGDLRDASVAAEACGGREAVFHLAACHGGRGYIDTHPVECSTNTILDGTVFAAAHRAGVKKVCFASSACVYPVDLQDRPSQDGLVYLKEEWTDPTGRDGASPDGEYGWAKLMGELTLRAYRRQHGIEAVSCRIFTAYGERENETHAVIALIAKAFVKMDPYVIWGTGEQDRNFTYVGDIVEGLLRAAEKVEDGSAVNLGTGKHIQIKTAAEMIFDHMGFRPNQLQFDSSKPVGVFSRAADLTLSRRLLDWEPQTTFRDGLAPTIDWYKHSHDPSEVEKQLDVLLTER